MDVHHATLTVGCDDHKAVMFTGNIFGRVILADGDAQDRRPVSTPNQVRLLLWRAFVHPLKPIVDGNDCTVRPDGAEEWAMSDFFNPGVDRSSAILSSMRSPSPTHHIGVEEVTFLVEQSLG